MISHLLSTDSNDGQSRGKNEVPSAHKNDTVPSLDSVSTERSSFLQLGKGGHSMFSRMNEAKLVAEGSEPSWKPVTLRPPMLLSMIAFAAVLIAALEYLSRLSEREGGIVFSTGSLPAYVTFINLYLPTILAVTLGMLWTWIDLDARRLEPFFRLSDPRGATAEESLDLDYPFDYISFASFKALRKG